MKLLGANNVVVTPIVEQKEGKVEKDDGKKQSKKFSPGLIVPRRAGDHDDRFPPSRATSSEVVVNSVITREGHHRSGKVVGVDSTLLRVMNLELAEGARFAPHALRERGAGRDHRPGREVALLHDGGPDRPARSRSATQWLTVVGVLEDRKVSSETAKRLGIRDAEHGRLRPAARRCCCAIRNRGEVTQSEMERRAKQRQLAPTRRRPTTSAPRRRNYHQLDKVIVQVDRLDGRDRGRRGRAPDAPAPAQRRHRLRDQRAGAAAEAGAAHEDDLQHRARRHRVDLARRRRDRDHEHHARVDPRAHQGDRRAARDGRDAEATILRAVPQRGGDDQPRRRRGRASSSACVLARRRSSGSRTSSTIVSPLSVVVAFGVSVAVGLVFGIVPASQRGEAGPDRLPALRVDRHAHRGAAHPKDPCELPLLHRARCCSRPARTRRRPPPTTLTLQDAIQRAQQQGPAAQVARSTRDAARCRDDAFNARLLPQLFLTGDAANLNRGDQSDRPARRLDAVRQANNSRRSGSGSARRALLCGT